MRAKFLNDAFDRLDEFREAYLLDNGASAEDREEAALALMHTREEFGINAAVANTLRKRIAEHVTEPDPELSEAESLLLVIERAALSAALVILAADRLEAEAERPPTAEELREHFEIDISEEEHPSA